MATAEMGDREAVGLVPIMEAHLAVLTALMDQAILDTKALVAELVKEPQLENLAIRTETPIPAAGRAVASILQFPEGMEAVEMVEAKIQAQPLEPGILGVVEEDVGHQASMFPLGLAAQALPLFETQGRQHHELCAH